MKIAILGYSGSGKSTLAQALGRHYGIPVLHLDSLHFFPGWVERPRSEELQIVGAFLEENDAWVIDGNYSGLHYERRLEEADRIVILLFNRFHCLYRVWRRYRKYRRTSRPDMAEGCPEKLDGAFIRWVLWEGRSRRARQRYRRVQNLYPEKAVVLKNQRQLDAFYAAIDAGETAASQQKL